VVLRCNLAEVKGGGRLIADAFAGVRAAVRARLGTFLGAAASVVVLSVLVPPVLLSVVRKPVDFFTINPWLRRLPEYLASPEHTVGTKIEKLWNLALFWFSADSPYGGTDWGFAVDVRDVARIVLTALLVGLYVALWREQRAMTRRGPVPAGPGARFADGAGRTGGIAGAFVGVIGLSTGPCSVVGCGAPVLPVVALAFAGLSSGTLKLLAGVGWIATAAVLTLLVVAVAYLSSRVGAERRFRAATRHV
jgi:hypothetical protein